MITQGRQNIEWLSIGGKQMDFLSRGRYNCSYSPYSAQATAALQAQFPTQWETIRQYGWQHPEVCQFINDDPFLVVSLISGLGTRWLVSHNTTSGGSVIEIPNGIGSYPVVDMLVKFNGGTSGGQTFAGTSSSENRRFNFYVNRPYGYVADYNGNSNVIIAASSDYNGTSGLIERRLKFGNGKFYINGVQKATFSPASKTYEPAGLTITPRANEPLWISEMEAISQGDTYPHKLVPFVGRTMGDGVYDIVTNKVHINTGTDKFTAVTETPAS